MGWVGAAIAVAGIAIDVIGRVNEADDQADAAARTAAIKDAQARELLERNAINEKILRERAEFQEHGYIAAVADTGFGGGGLGGVMKIRRDLAMTLENNRRDAEFRARMLRAGADVDMQLASDAVSASYISGAGTILSQGAKTYTAYSAPSSTTSSLPKVGET
jgi:hypothetical protein